MEVEAISNISNPEKVSLTVITKNLLGRKWPNVNVQLTRIDDCYYHNIPVEIIRTTDGEGKCVFESILEGDYLIHISTKRVFLEKLYTIQKDETIDIRLPSVFGWFRKGKRVEEDKVREEICFECRMRFKGFKDKFRCKYCGEYFCSEHRLPEKHNCRGDPKSPPHSYRIIYSKGKGRIINK